MDNAEIKTHSLCQEESGKAIHFMGLTSDGGVHSSLDHLFALCDIAKSYGLEKVYIHCFMDGRDTDPRSGKGFIEQLSPLRKSAGKIRIGYRPLLRHGPRQALGARQDSLRPPRQRRGRPSPPTWLLLPFRPATTPM